MSYEIPYPDPITESIDLYRRTWDDLMRQRIRTSNRAVDPISGAVRSDFLLDIADIHKASEEKVKRRLTQLVREHPMGPWLEEAKTAGARVATILAMIRHPHRFPGQKCSEGCYMLPTFEPGDSCPVASVPEKSGEPEPCEGIIQPPRRGTGCRALWHMSGLYPVGAEHATESDNSRGPHLPRARKGQQLSHNPTAKTAILMPQGIAQQFYMQGSRYAEVYYREKERLAERSPEKAAGWLDATARVIAAKAWLGDLLMEWKRIVPLEPAEVVDEIEVRRGELVAGGA